MKPGKDDVELLDDSSPASVDSRYPDIDLAGKSYEENLERDIRNAFGTFYTPRPIIRYIIENLDLDKVLDDLQDPTITAKPRILDPACGSGGFLAMFYDCMKARMKAAGWDNDRIVDTLSSLIYGLDIDELAVQLATMNLRSMTSRVDADATPVNVYQVDAVRDTFEDGSSMPEFARMRFRFIVSNPPFFEIEKFDAFPALYPELQHDSKPNIATLFLYRYLHFLEDDGILAFVFPASILFSDSYISIRREIVDKYKILKIIQLGKAFSDVGLEQVILMIQKTADLDGLASNAVQILRKNTSRPALSFKASETLQQHFQLDRKRRFRVFLDDETLPIIVKVEDPERTACLGDACLEYVDKSGEPCLAIFRGMGWERKKQIGKTATCATPVIKGTNIMRYGIKGTFYVENMLALNRKSPGSKGQGVVVSQTLELMKTRDKILVQRLVSSRTRLVATSDASRIITLSTALNIFLKDDAPWDMNFVVAVLNSEFMAYYVIDHVFMHARLSTSIDANYARYLPIPLASTGQQQRLLDIVREIKEIVAEGISLGKDHAEIEGQADYQEKDREINDCIYGLYHVTEQEKEIVLRRLQDFYIHEE